MALRDHKRLTVSFFRKVNSPELFQLFFEEFRVFQRLELPENPKNDQIHKAWKGLVAPNRERIEEDLKRINDIACEAGRYTLYFWAERCGLARISHD